MSIAFPTPDPAILARRDEILRGLAPLVAREALIASRGRAPRLRDRRPDGLPPGAARGRAAVDDARRSPRSCASATSNGVKVVPRGAGTSLSGGAIAQEDAIILGVAKMNRVLDIDFENRTARVQSGITNLAITQAIAHEGFFYAPDPSWQLACTIAGNIAHELRRRALPEIRRDHQQPARRHDGA